MSQWTHVSGIFRVDGMPQMGITANLKAILGTPSSDYDAEPYEKGHDIPGGSEGTIQYAINDAGDGLVWKTVAVWGDLRDFGAEDCPEIDEWFARIVAGADKAQLKTTRLMLREAHLLVRVEYGIEYMLVMRDAEDFDMPRLVERVELSGLPTEGKGQP